MLDDDFGYGVRNSARNRGEFYGSLSDQKHYAALVFDQALRIEAELANEKSVKPTRMRLRFYHDFALSLEAASVRAFF